MAAIVGAPFSSFTLRKPGAEPEELRAQRVTAGFFDVLRIRPALGRAFTAENEIDGRHRVAVLSDGLWRRRFGGESRHRRPDNSARRRELRGRRRHAAGLIRRIRSAARRARPISGSRTSSRRASAIRNPDSGRSIYLKSIARLKPGVSIEQAQAQMDQIAAALETGAPGVEQGQQGGRAAAPRSPRRRTTRSRGC